jgi:hypothetical protein
VVIHLPGEETGEYITCPEINVNDAMHVIEISGGGTVAHRGIANRWCVLVSRYLKMPNAASIAVV